MCMFDRLFNHRHLLFTYTRVCAPRLFASSRLYALSLYTKNDIFSRVFFVRVVYFGWAHFHQKHIDKEMGGTYFVIFAKGNADFMLCKAFIEPSRYEEVCFFYSHRNFQITCTFIHSMNELAAWNQTLIPLLHAHTHFHTYGQIIINLTK